MPKDTVLIELGDYVGVAAANNAGIEYAGLRSFTPTSTTACYALLAADKPPAPPQLRKALLTIGSHITDAMIHARLLPNAA